MTTPVRLLFAALMAGALAVSAQTRPANEAVAETFGEAIDVRAVNVEAVVTDSSGERVRGLSAADFRLLVDGKEVPIDYFTEIANSQAAAPATPAADAGQAGTTGETAPQAPAFGTVGRSLLIFVDESFSLETDLEIVLLRLQSALQALGPEDQVAVVAFDGRRLTVLSDWSRDRAAIGAVLEAARQRPAHGILVKAEHQAVLNNAIFKAEAEVAASGEDGSVVPQLDLWPGSAAPALRAGRSSLETAALDSLAGLVPQSRSRVSRVGAATIAALRSFASAPGRKAALLLSGGWPLGTAPDVFPRLVETANLLGYTLYPIDVTGIEAPPVQLTDARMGPVDLAALTGSAMNVNTVYTFISSDYEQDVELGLKLLARETGGQASLNSNRLAALDRVLTDTSSYYWLGFSPTWRADGRRHSIRVEVRQRGLAVRSRNGYSDLTREADRALQMDSRLVFGGVLRERRLLVQVGAPRLLDRRTMEVTVTLQVPADVLPPSTTGGRYTAELPLRIAAVDDRHNRLELEPLKLRVDLDQAPPASGYARFQTTLKLPRRNSTLRFAVHDPIGDKLVWGETEVTAEGVQGHGLPERSR